MRLLLDNLRDSCQFPAIPARLWGLLFSIYFAEEWFYHSSKLWWDFPRDSTWISVDASIRSKENLCVSFFFLPREDSLRARRCCCCCCCKVIQIDCVDVLDRFPDIFVAGGVGGGFLVVHRPMRHGRQLAAQHDPGRRWRRHPSHAQKISCHVQAHQRYLLRLVFMSQDPPLFPPPRIAIESLIILKKWP